MTVTLAPGDMGIDISGFRLNTTARVNDFKKAGGKFVLRYSAGAASDPRNPNHGSVSWKLITPGEFHALIADGFDVIANDEWYESRCTEGSAAGKADGAAAGALWHSCGLYRGASIYVSWDAAPVSSKWANVVAYATAYQAALNAYGYHFDMYVGTPMLKHMFGLKKIRYGWRPNAGSWSNDGLPYQPNMSTAAARLGMLHMGIAKTPAHIWQTGNYWFSKQADECMILRAPVGSHWDAYRAAHATPAPAPKPAPAPAPKPYYSNDGHGAVAITSVDGNWAVYLTNEGKLQVRHKLPANQYGVQDRLI